MSDEARSVRVMTWNIHGGIGRDGRHDLARVVALVRRHNPDIVALQEVDSRGRQNVATPVLSFLTQALGSHAAEARTITAPDGHYGHVLISRWPLSRQVLHDVSVTGREPRFAIEAIAATDHGPLHLTAVHLGFMLSERRHHADKLAHLVKAAPETFVMLGDFNEWPWRDAVRRGLASTLPGITRLRTYHARFPLLRLDRIYCRPGSALLRSWTDSAGAEASDHLPVFADIQPWPLRPPAGEAVA